MRRLLVLVLLVLALPAAAQTYQAAVVSPWAGTGTKADPYRPALGQEYPGITWDDITGQTVAQLLPSPNAYTLLVTCDGDTLDTIEDDTDYVVLWTEAVPVEVAQAEPRGGIIEALWALVSPRDAWAEIKPQRKKTDRAKKDLPPTAERNKLRTNLKKLGYTTKQANALIRDGVVRGVIQNDVIAVQKIAPKAQ